jgi:hypothetical protein
MEHLYCDYKLGQVQIRYHDEETNKNESLILGPGQWNDIIWGWLRQIPKMLEPGKLFRLVKKVDEFFNCLRDRNLLPIQRLTFNREEQFLIRRPVQIRMVDNVFYPQTVINPNESTSIWNAMKGETQALFIYLTIKDKQLVLTPETFNLQCLR